MHAQVSPCLISRPRDEAAEQEGHVVDRVEEGGSNDEECPASELERDLQEFRV